MEKHITYEPTSSFLYLSKECAITVALPQSDRKYFLVNDEQMHIISASSIMHCKTP